jgi:hypothetical protein
LQPAVDALHRALIGDHDADVLEDLREVRRQLVDRLANQLPFCPLDRLRLLAAGRWGK